MSGPLKPGSAAHLRAKVRPTITDAQLRELHTLITTQPGALVPVTPPGVDRVTFRAEVIRACERAMYNRLYTGARARCAAIMYALDSAPCPDENIDADNSDETDGEIEP